MPCEDSKMENGNTTSPTPVNQDGQQVPLFNLVKPTEVPSLADNGNGAVGGHQAGGDRVLITYITSREEQETVKNYPQPTITITTGLEKVTVTITMTPSTLAALPTGVSQVQTSTSTVTAAPLGGVNITTGIAVGVPIACIFGTSFIVFGIFLWCRRKRSRDNKRHLEAAVAAIGVHDGSSDDPSTPLAIPRRPPGGNSPNGPKSGIVAPPSSLASQAGPFGDPTLRHGDRPVRNTPRGSGNDSQDIQSQTGSFAGSYGTMPPSNPIAQGSPNSRLDAFLSRRSSIVTIRTDNTNVHREMYRAESAENANNPDDNEVFHFEDDHAGRTLFPNQLGTVVYVPPANGNGDDGPIIQPTQTAPLRPLEVTNRALASQRASIIDVAEDQRSEIRSSSIVPDSPERTDIAELEGSSVPCRVSSATKGKAQGEGHASEGKDEPDGQTLGKDEPFELSTDNPIHELSADGAIVPATIEQKHECKKDGDNEGNAKNDAQDDDTNTKDGDQPDQRAESSIKQ